MSAAAAQQSLNATGAPLGGTGGIGGSTMPLNIKEEPPLHNPGRAGTKIGPDTHHPPSNRYASQWHEATQHSLNQASSTQGHAAELMNFSLKTHSAAQSVNVAQYQAVHDAFSKKINTNRHLCDLIDERMRAHTISIARTKATLATLQTAYNSKKEPLSLCVWRQTQRTRRPYGEMIRDGFEIALEEEKECLLSAQDKLHNAMHASEQMVLVLNDSLKDLAHDYEVKMHSMQVDESCIRKTHTTWPAMTHDGAPARPPATDASLPYKAWHDSSEEKRVADCMARIERCRDKETYYQLLQSENDKLIASTAQDCQQARSNVEEKMRERISEVQEKRREIEISIAETQEKIESMTQCRALTETEIRAQEEPEFILQQRMDLRAARSGEENIPDPVTTELLEQQNTLKQTRAMLERRKDEEKQSLAMLAKSKADMVADLAEKGIALNLDLECQKTSARDAKVIAAGFRGLDL